MNLVFPAGNHALGRRVFYEVLGCFDLLLVVLILPVDVIPRLRAIMNSAIPVIFTGCIRNKAQQVIYFSLGISKHASRKQRDC